MTFKRLTHLRRSALAFLLTVFLVSAQSLTASAAVSPASGPESGGTAVSFEGFHFVQISAGVDHALALDSEGSVWAWGSNEYGQLGNGDSGLGKYSAVPVKVKGIGGTGYLENVTQVSAGNRFSVALTPEGVVTWGINENGELGIGTASSGDLRSFPFRVVQAAGEAGPYLTGVLSIDAGNGFTLANTSQGLVSWGYGNAGQLGDGTFTAVQPIPQWVLGPGSSTRLLNVSDYSAGSFHALAIVPAGVVAWGDGGFGALGTGSSAVSTRPIFAGNGSPITNALSVAAGEDRSLMLTDTGVFAWGSQQFAPLGVSDTISYVIFSPRQVINYSGGSGTYLQNVTAVEASAVTMYAVTPDGIYAWGEGNFGQFGMGSLLNSDVPVLVNNPLGSGNYSTTQLTAGGYFMLFETAGKLFGTGQNLTGQLGRGSATANNNPQNTSPALSVNILPGSVLFGTGSATALSALGSQWTATSPAAGAGQVALTATANVFGGTTPGVPSSVTWNAGTFTYEAALANTGAPNNAPLLIASGIAVLLGIGLLIALRRQNRK